MQRKLQPFYGKMLFRGSIWVVTSTVGSPLLFNFADPFLQVSSSSRYICTGNTKSSGNRRHFLGCSWHHIRCFCYYVVLLLLPAHYLSWMLQKRDFKEYPDSSDNHFALNCLLRSLLTAAELRIHAETERGDNDTIKMPNGQKMKIDGKTCCS
jgi:hypothetical protein